jgi:GntR family transcriptional regulator of gluconate operon
MRSAQLQPLRRNTLGKDAAAVLRDAIVSGKISQGTRLVEEDLAQQMGVSRGPVRDALRELIREGIVEQTPSGVLVVGLDQEGIRQLLEYRALLEIFSLRRVVATKPPEVVDELRQIHERMGSPAVRSDPAAFALADMEFHRWIVTHSGNRLVTQNWENISHTIESALRITDRRSRTISVLGYHLAILGAMQKRDVQEAEQALQSHLAEACKILVDILVNARVSPED